MYYVHSPWLTNQKIKEKRSLSVVEMHQSSTRFQEVRKNSHSKRVQGEGRGYRRGKPSDVVTLRWFPSPKISLFPEQQKRFRATWSQNRLKPKWFYKVLNPKRFSNAGFSPAECPQTRRQPIFYSSLVLWRRVQGRERS